MIAELLPWAVVLVAAVVVVQLAVTARRASTALASGATPAADRHRLLTRAVGSLTFVLLAGALGPWGPSTWPLWGVLAAGWAWGALTAAPTWRRLPRHPTRRSGRGARAGAAAGLVGEAGLLLAVIAFVVV